MSAFDISTSDNLEFYEPVKDCSFDKIKELITTTKWSPGIFQNNKRNLKSFMYADCIGLDVDDDLCLDEAVELMKDYKCIIAPTKSHNKDKNGKTAHRFRILVFTDGRITNEKDYTATWKELEKIMPQLDGAAKDGSRYYEPSIFVFFSNANGKPFPISKYVKSDTQLSIVEDNNTTKVNPGTADFLLNLAPHGQRNGRLFAAAADTRANGWTQDQFIKAIKEAIQRTSNWGHDELSSKDLGTIQSAWNKDKEDLYREDRPNEDTIFNLMSLSDMENPPEIDWLVDDMLARKAFSIISADPKAGKSTIVRQLIKAVLHGDRFFGREVQRGKVLYFALEEQPEMLRKQFGILGINNNDPITTHVGSLQLANPTSHVLGLVEELEPDLVVIDTLHLFTHIKDMNNYAECNEAMKHIRDMARSTNAHFIFVHHSNKGDSFGGRSMLGSQALFGSADTIITVNLLRNSTDRFLTTQQRGGTPFTSVKLKFDMRKQMYSIAGSSPAQGSF